MASGSLKRAAVLLVWLAVIPVLLTGFGRWQVERDRATLAEYEEARAGLPDVLARVKETAARDPMTILHFQGGLNLAAGLAVTQIEEALASLDGDILMARIRLPLAWGTVAGGALALAGGMLGLMASGLASRRARRSRAHLVGSFGALRLALPVLLALMVVGGSLAILAGSLFEAGGLWFEEQLSVGEAKLAFAAIVIAGLAACAAFLALRGLRQVFALYVSEPFDLSGRLVDETEAPALWRFVRGLAARQEALVPDAIVVGLTDGFFVTEAPIRLWPEDRQLEGRTLYLPAPYLGLLDEAEITAIIGHELAHFSGEDTVYSRRFAPIHTALWRAIAALRGDELANLVLYPASRLGFHALGSFDAAVGHWRRLRELEADRGGALVSGPEAAASALLRSSLVAPGITTVLNTAFGKPEDWSDERAGDLVAAVSGHVRENGFGDPADHLEDHQPHPTDSHPSTAHRIAALGLTADAALMARAARLPGTEGDALPRSFFADWPGLCRGLSNDFLANARRAHADHRARLEANAAAVPEGEQALYENARPMVWTMAILAILLLGVGVAVMAYSMSIGLQDPTDMAIFLGILALPVLGAGAAALLFRRRGRTAFMVLTPDRLVSPFLSRPVDWGEVVGINVTASNRLTLSLALAEQAELPSSASRRHAKVDKARRVVALRSLGVRGMKANAYAALIGRYLDAAYARRMLAEQGDHSAPTV